MPWSAWLLWQLARRKAQIKVLPLRSGDGWLLYLLCWMFAPVVFFTMSSNILPTYVLPSLAAFGLLVADVWAAREGTAATRKVPWLALVTPTVVVLLVWVVWPRTGFQSQKEILAAYHHAAERDSPLVYYGRRQSSVDFYSRGTVKLIVDDAQLRAYLDKPVPTYVAIEQTRFKQFPGELRAQFATVVVARNGRFMLLRHASAVRRGGLQPALPAVPDSVRLSDQRVVSRRNRFAPPPN